MIDRCENPKGASYHNYGGRGITICPLWRNDFTAFCEWARTHGYRQGLSIDRIDNDGDYSPDNCRFVGAKEQARNRRTNHIISFQGETKTLIEWAETIDMHPHTLQKRLASGWSIKRALTTPTIKSKSSIYRRKEREHGNSERIV